MVCTYQVSPVSEMLKFLHHYLLQQFEVSDGDSRGTADVESLVRQTIINALIMHVEWTHLSETFIRFLVVGCTRVRPEGRWVHAESLGSLGFALGVVPR